MGVKQEVWQGNIVGSAEIRRLEEFRVEPERDTVAKWLSKQKLSSQQYNHLQSTQKHQMTAFRRQCSRTATSYSEGHHHHHRQDSFPMSLKNFYLRKSLFDPPQEVAEAFASRWHIAGAQVPRLEILHYSPRWLLLQAPHTRSNFFEKLNQGKLGCKEDQILKIFKSFVALVHHYGYFRPTAKMIFLEKMEVRVWMSEDVFSTAPMMPITRGAEGEKHFVIAFLAMVETYLDKWDRVTNVTTIQDTLRMLEWRCQLAKGSTTDRACHQTQLKFGESIASFSSAENECRMISSSQCLSEAVIKPDSPKNNYAHPKPTNFVRHASELKTFSSKAINFLENSEVENIEANRKQKFALHSTSSTIGAFCEKWRTTMGRKKLLEKAEHFQTPCSNQCVPSPPSPQAKANEENNIQMEFEDLFAEEQAVDYAELQRIAEQIEQVLTW